ncbi:purine permease 3-like isoform X2 [Curcuma longa]|uniref:purine permease 3-like isoform X2 n=1 Tax=Curcuma longa TaxID=136217 RepID=UPI003D9E50AE
MIDHSMDSEGQASNNEQGDKAGLQRRAPLILLNVILMALGNTGGPLLVRLYFRCGGKRRWLSSWLGTAGWPVILLTLFCSYLRCRLSGRHTKLFFITPRLVLSCAAVGLLTGMDDFLYVYGLSFLPVSTSALLVSTQLAFTALFSFLLVKQRFTAYSINAVGLLTVGAAILGLHVRSDRQENETRREYYVGFALTLAAAALYGLILPLMELMYAKAKQAITYTLVLEMQLAIGIFASSFCMGGMLLNKDFQVRCMIPINHIASGTTNKKALTPSDSRGGEGIWTGKGEILFGSCLQCRLLAVLLLGHGGSHLLREHAARRRPHRGVHSGDGVVGRRLLEGEV